MVGCREESVPPAKKCLRGIRQDLSKSRNSKKAKRILHIVVAAARPLTLREMALASSILENRRSYSDLDLGSESRFRETIRDICGLFVAIIDSRIYLLHQTAKEFLVRNGQEIYHESEMETLTSASTSSCRGLYTIPALGKIEANILDNDAVLSQYDESHVFLDYSAKHWAAHVRESHIGVDDAATRSDASSKHFLTWFRIWRHIWAFSNLLGRMKWVLCRCQTVERGNWRSRIWHQATILERSRGRFCGQIWPNTTGVCGLERARGRRQATA